MGSKRLRVLPAEVCRAREQFDRWRANKQERERIPPRLWVVAGGLCETHSTRRVARWLRLNHKSLQGQLGRRCDRRRSQPKPALNEAASRQSVHVDPL